MQDKHNKLQSSTSAWNKFVAGVEEIIEHKGSIYSALDKAQEVFGYISRDCVKHIANKFHTTSTEVYSIASFVARYHFKKQGKYNIAVCIGSACHTGGADKILAEFKKQLGIDEDETTDDGMFTLTTVRCVGSCGLAPVVIIDNELHGKMTVEKINELLNSYRAKEEE